MAPSNLKSWFENVGIQLASGVVPVSTKDKGLGLIALNEYQTLKPDDDDEENPEESIVAKVPMEMVLNCQRILEMAVDDVKLRECINVDNCSGTSLLHRGLIYLWLIKRETPWKEYFKELPEDINLPFSYSINDMEELNFSAVSIHHAALMKRLNIEKAFERFTNSNIGRNSGITLEQWLIPHKWISSRGLTHPFTGETSIVPAIDLCNHNSNASNVRYDVDNEGNFELRVLPGRNIAGKEICLDYGKRSISEFVFNYGFIPEDRLESDFDEIFKVFDPSDEDIRDVLDQSRHIKDIENDKRIELALSYDFLLEYFSEEIPQVLRIVRLPMQTVPEEDQRYRYHCNFIAALACYEHFELISIPHGDTALYLDGKEVKPCEAFETMLKYDDAAVIKRSKKIVGELCNTFYKHVSAVSTEDTMISKLAKAEASIYQRFAELNR